MEVATKYSGHIMILLSGIYRLNYDDVTWTPHRTAINRLTAVTNQLLTS
jgi:hypothetical protein